MALSSSSGIGYVAANLLVPGMRWGSHRWCRRLTSRLALVQLFHYVYETIPPKKNKYITAYEKRRRFREDKKWVEENHEQSKLMSFVKADAVANYRVRGQRGQIWPPTCAAQ